MLLENTQPLGDADIGLTRSSFAKIAVPAFFVTGSIGPYLVRLELLGFTLFPFRLLVIVLFAFGALHTLKRGRLYWPRVATTQVYLVLLSLWIMWGGLSLFWSPSMMDGVKEITGLAFGFVSSLVLLWVISYSLDHLPLIVQGWTLAYLSAGGVAVWSLVTGAHLPGYWADNAPAYAKVGTTAATFGNPNDYAAFVLMAVPFLWFACIRARRFMAKGFYSLLLASVPALLMICGSRLAFFGFLAFVAWAMFRSRTRVGLAVCALALLGLSALAQVTHLDLYLEKLSILFERTGSVMVRYNLALNALWGLLLTGGLGLGAGGFETWLGRGSLPGFPTSEIVNPHGLMLEILSQYGVVVFGLFMFWLAVVLRFSVWLRSSGDSQIRVYSHLLESMLLVYLIASWASSSFLLSSAHWMFIASLLAVSTTTVHVLRERSKGNDRNARLT